MKRKVIAAGIIGLAVVLLVVKRKKIAENLRAALMRLPEPLQYDYVARVIQARGGVLKTGPYQKNILGLRKSTDTNTNEGKGAYDDLFVLIWRDQNGNKYARQYPGNTEPSAFYRGKMGIDVDRDGRLDQGRLVPGFFEYKPGTSSQLGFILRPVRDAPVERDVNHDGIFNDRATSGGGGTMLFHTGGTKNVVSAGCQTMPPPEWRRFWDDVNAGGTNGPIGYTLIEA